ncbi:MAG: hypothetical protein RIT81_18395 [Deltaproteobacteria bacterium]
MKRALFLLFFAAPASAYAHGGQPAVADLVAPTSLCPVADEGKTFEWVDQDTPALSGEVFINFYATRVQPETTFRTEFPDVLEELPVAFRVPELDLTNQAYWKTSTVATGVYWIWSQVFEPPEEMSPRYLSLSPVPVVVHHEGDAVPSAVAITRPNSALAVADQMYRIEYTALDPTGTGRIRLEARPFRDDDWHVIADNLPALRAGEYLWNTAQLPEGDWILRATMHDCSGTETVAYTRHVLFVSHPTGPKPDAGADLDAGIFDAVVPDWCDEPPRDPMLESCGVETAARDAGATPDAGGETDEPTGCSCAASRAESGSENGSEGGSVVLLALGLLTARTVRRRFRRPTRS